MRTPLMFASFCLAGNVLLAHAQDAAPRGPVQGPEAPEPPPTYELDKSGKRNHIDFSLKVKPISDANLALSQFANRKLLVFYFSAKCPHCQHAAPFVQKLSDDLAAKGYVTVAIAIKYNSDDDIRGFIRDYSIRMPVFQDDDRVFGENYGTGSIPLLILVNPKGEYIRYKSFDPNETPKMILDVASSFSAPAKSSAPSVTGTRKVNVTFSHAVAASQGGDLLLDHLCRLFPYHSRPDWETRIRQGKIRVNGNSAPPEMELRPAMRVEYQVEDYEEPEVPNSFREIARRENLSLVHKPAGLPVHKTGKIFFNTLANLYRLEQRNDAWSPLNRLDVETSGIVAFARGREALKLFSPLEPGTRWVKMYLAVVQGEAPEHGTIDLPLGEKPGDPIRNRMHPDPKGKASTTLYRNLATRFGKSLLLLRPLTGRKHQIRAHCAASGFPVVGDKAYSLDGRFYLKRMESPLTDADFAELGAPHQLLHAFFLDIGTEAGAGIAGVDNDLPPHFFDLFPELRTLLPGLPESREFKALAAF